ncbi:hypothetical protein EJ110_NYTH30122 [Nymphaea thermarum]|nr:hypothetical protein EJ110_NYTH30122 [Nymphaea thermarum]
MVVAILLVTVTFQAAPAPPSGFSQGDSASFPPSFKLNVTVGPLLVSANNSPICNATSGTTVLRSAAYDQFMKFDIFAFSASLFVIFLLLVLNWSDWPQPIVLLMIFLDVSLMILFLGFAFYHAIQATEPAGSEASKIARWTFLGIAPTSKGNGLRDCRSSCGHHHHAYVVKAIGSFVSVKLPDELSSIRCWSCLLNKKWASDDAAADQQTGELQRTLVQLLTITSLKFLLITINERGNKCDRQENDDSKCKSPGIPPRWFSDLDSSVKGPTQKANPSANTEQCQMTKHADEQQMDGT